VDAGEVEAPGAVLDEDQGVQALEGHGVEVQEIGGDDAVGLGGEELAPGRTESLRGRVDTGSMQALPDRGRGDRVAEAGKFALYAAVAPAAVLAGQAQDELLDRRRGGGATAVLGERPFTLDEFPVPAQQRGRRDREDLTPSPARDQPRQRGRLVNLGSNHQPVPDGSRGTAWARGTGSCRAAAVNRVFTAAVNIDNRAMSASPQVRCTHSPRRTPETRHSQLLVFWRQLYERTPVNAYTSPRRPG
jgi:hypothetical protein